VVLCEEEGAECEMARNRLLGLHRERLNVSAKMWRGSGSPALADRECHGIVRCYADGISCSVGGANLHKRVGQVRSRREGRVFPVGKRAF